MRAFRADEGFDTPLSDDKKRIAELEELLETCDGTDMSMEWRDAVRAALAKLEVK